MDHVTVIGSATYIQGNIEGKEALVLQGKIEGVIDLKNTFTIEESGVAKGEFQVKDAIISGIVVGTLQAENSVELTETAMVVGDITAPSIAIQDGARFRGKIVTGDAEAPAKLEAPTARKRLGDSKSSFGRNKGTAKPIVARKNPLRTLGTVQKDEPKKLEKKDQKFPVLNKKINTQEAEKIAQAVQETIQKKNLTHQGDGDKKKD